VVVDPGEATGNEGVRASLPELLDAVALDRGDLPVLGLHLHEVDDSGRPDDDPVGDPGGRRGELVGEGPGELHGPGQPGLGHALSGGHAGEPTRSGRRALPRRRSGRRAASGPPRKSVSSEPLHYVVDLLKTLRGVYRSPLYPYAGLEGPRGPTWDDA